MADVEMKDKNDYDDDDDSLSSSDSDDDMRPPPPIQIERSADLGTLKSALFNKEKPVENKQPKEAEAGLGKEALSNITNAFEKPETLSGAKVEREQIVVDKEQYSSFKQKFEHLDKELAKQEADRRAQAEPVEIEGIGAEILKEAKAMFEHGQKENAGKQPPEKIEIERSDADRKRVKETFFETTDKEEPRDCAVCGKMVYPVEKVLAEKRVFHKACFKCTTCQKTLSVQGYASHEGKLYCKIHYMEIYRPEVGLAHGEATFEADTGEPDDEEEYAVVAKPKMLDPSVVRSGMKSTDDLDNIPKLQNAKKQWAESAEQAKKVEKSSGVEADLIQQGKVKSRLTKFVEGGGEGEEEPEEDEDDPNRDPNIIRSTKKKEAIHIETGAKSIKSKWDSGTVERAQGEMQDRTGELDEIKKNVSVKERFKERTGNEEEEAGERRSAILAEEPLDTTFTKSAKERFQKGEAFEGHAFEKTAIDARCAELGNIKAAFAQAKGDDPAAAEARRQLQEEFERIKGERMAMKEKAMLEAAEGADGEGQKNIDDVRQSADMGSIKKRFEEGTAYTTGVEKKADEQLEIKVAGKAREKFKQIDQEAPKEPVINQPAAKAESKWTKDKGAAPEPINRRVQDEEEPEEPEDFDVKSLMNKFKNVGEEGDKKKKPGAAAEELAALQVEAKNLKDRFEKVGQEGPEGETAEEKRKRLEEEFKRIKELKESQQPEEEEPEPELKDEGNQDLAIAAEHAAKAKAKWDKIQRKEAKKAEKAAALAAKGKPKAGGEAS